MKRLCWTAVDWLLCTSAADAEPSAWLQTRTAGMQELRGRFSQTDYGFSVSPPRGAREYAASGVSGDHDVLMILGDHREIVVDAEYADPDWGHTQPCGRGQIPWERTGKREAGSARLGSQAACQLVFVDGGNAWGVIQAAGSDRGQGVIHTLLLATAVNTLRQDLASLREAAASFRRTPVVP